ncbi:lysozyme [Pectobacterium quasiaquaticum]|uniref:Lysozyme n=1 Tax=Pectobacterium quasiaquaticum TaxID=2774015 RepID=A0A9Q2EVW9_9GAMM|nr:MULTISPECIES: lysozyme [Pectobacterium]MBE5203421.1 lysozyme [Pectobacterium quasiaquaticum]MBE5211652.1 lysozyme [Pectobacterium quasiaquaticum]MBE5214316.1 lysozyme [Pectobacterium quasiaquaticum]MBE5220541.1 lysozyme [Pectobacterium quasiaquaticum]MBE5225257.1 lysozyme [Pectobacterium quasiaquaticum]
MANIPGTINEAGLSLIKSFEGLKLTKYRDTAGKWTIGYGHLILPNENFDNGITLQEADSLLQQDLKTAETGVQHYVNVDLNDNQFGALTSFTYNLGVNSLKTSTLLRLLNQGDYTGAADQFPRWDKDGEQIVAGLLRRREAEQALFLQAITSN